jgi:hypothetical protein
MNAPTRNQITPPIQFPLKTRTLAQTSRATAKQISGGHYFLGFIPLVGGIILIVFFAGASDPAGARFDQPHT